MTTPKTDDRLRSTDAVPMMTDEHADFLSGLRHVDTPDEYQLTVDMHRLIEALASGALRTYDPQTHVAVPREEIRELRACATFEGHYYRAHAITQLARWLADGNEEGR